MKLALALLTAISLVFPATAEVVVIRDFGGSVSQHEEQFERIRDSGEQVVIAGSCWSACMLILAYVPLERMCAEPLGQFAYHPATRVHDGTIDWEETRRQFGLFPKTVQDWIESSGGVYKQGLRLYPYRVRATKFLTQCNNSDRRPQ